MIITQPVDRSTMLYKKTPYRLIAMMDDYAFTIDLRSIKA